MKRAVKTAQTIFALSLVFAFAQIAFAQDGTVKTVNVRFKPGATSASYSGTVRGYNSVDYVLSASEGQQMRVKTTSRNNFLYFNVLDKSSMTAIDGGTEVTEFDGALPKSGSYVVRVYLVRAEARRNKTAVPFTINIGVTGSNASNSGGGSTSNSNARTNVVNYDCGNGLMIKATYVLSNPGSVRLEEGGGMMELPQVPSGSGAKYESSEMLFWSKGREATMERGGRTYNCKQR